MAWFTAELLADAIRWADAEEIAVAVETGTFEGQTTQLLARHFPTVHTIELEPQRWRRAIETPGRIGATFHLGDSAGLLPYLSAAYCDAPVCWYLDAHWWAEEKGSGGKWNLPVANENPFPLWAELETIAGRTQADLVIVDDVHAFGRDELDWRGVSSASLDQALGGRLDRSRIVEDQYQAVLKKL
jgi:hypothetical protein